MRAFPSDLADRLDSGAASLCHAWILTRADGVTCWASPTMTATWWSRA
jgi:hypothetical protein